MLIQILKLKLLFCFFKLFLQQSDDTPNWAH